MKKHILYLIILLVLSFTACSRESKNTEKLAEVNGEILYLEEFVAMIGEDNWMTMDSSARHKAVEDWVNLTLLAQTAKKNKLLEKQGVILRQNIAQKKVAANALISEKLSTINISEDQLFSYFRVHRAEFMEPVQFYRVQRICLPSKIQAENVFEKIRDGLDFMQALSRYKAEAPPHLSGDMGFVQPSSADSVFWFSAKQLELNEPGIIKKDDYWFVIRYTEKKEGDDVANFDDFKAEIRHKILLEKQEDVYRELLREIKTKAGKVFYY